MIKVSCAIIVESGRVLCVQRSLKMSHPLKWEFPGGKIEEEESPKETLKREIFEELNIEIEILDNLSELEYSYGEALSVRLFPFICKIKSGNICVSEHKDFVWLEPEEMKNIDFLEADKSIIEEVISRDLKEYE